MKKIFSTLLSLLLTFSMMPVSSFADYENISQITDTLVSEQAETSENSFEFDKETKTIKKYKGTDKDVVIPEEIDGVTIEKIGKKAFLKSKIDSVTFNKKLEEVDDSAFAYSTLKTAVLNEGLKKIGDTCFSNCQNLENINLPNSLTYLGKYVFIKSTKISGELVLGENLEKVFPKTFKNCNNVKIIIAEKGVPITIYENNLYDNNLPISVPNTRKVFIAAAAFKGSNQDNYSVDLGTIDVKENLNKEELKKELEKIPFRIVKTGKNYSTLPYTLVWELDDFDLSKSNAISAHIESDKDNKNDKIKVTVKLNTESKSKYPIWTSEDFTYGNIPSTMLKSPTFFGVTGLSKKGREKIKTEKHLVIPYEVEIREGNKTITKKIRGIGKEAFNKLEIKKLTLPEMKDGYNKFIIDSSAFADNELTELNIPDGVFAFDTFAFANNDIKKLYIPSSVLKIGSEAFKNNKISDLEISDDVFKIQLDNYSFMNNKLKEVHIPYSVFKIKHYVFKDNPGKDGKGQVYLYTRNPKHLTSDTYMYSSEYQKFILVSEGISRENLFSTIRLASSLNPEEYKEKSWNKMKEILEDAKMVFKNKTSSQNEIDNANKKLNDTIKNLSPANVIKTNLENEIKKVRDYDEKLYTAESWSKFKSSLTNAEKILKDEDVEQADVDNAVSKLKASIKSLEIKDEMKWTKEDFTYDGSKITGYSKSGSEKYKVNKFLIIPSTTPDGKPVTSIGKEAFITTEGVVYRTDDVSSPLGLKAVKIPDTVEVIEDSAFRQNNLSHVDLPKSLKYIGNTAFNANQLKSIEVPDSVTKMGSGCFSLNLIEKVKFSKRMKEVPDGVLSRNIYLKSVEIPEGVNRIGKSAFVGAPIAELHIPSSVKTIDYKAFSGQRCKELYIPGNVKYIGKLAFEENVKFRHTKKLILGEGIKEILSGAFKSCLLSEVKLPSSLIKLDDDAFNDNLDERKNPITVKLISSNPEHAKMFKNNKMQKIIIEPKKIIHHSSSKKLIDSVKIDDKNNTHINRIEGENRIETAIEISKKYFKRANHIVLVSSNHLTDSLISPLQAKKLDSPILLSEKNKISDSTLDEIKRLQANEIDIIGGSDSISENVVKELEKIGIRVNRISGSDRYETSLKLADNMYKNTPYDEVYVVDSNNLADGLSVANLSTKLDTPVLLTHPKKINKTFIDFMKKKNIKKVHIIGGKNSVSPEVEKTLVNFKTDRIAGANRYETSKIVVKMSYPNAKSIHISNGETGIDALVCGAIIPKTNMPMLLVNNHDHSISKWFKNFGISDVNIIGGKNSINEDYANSLLN